MHSSQSHEKKNARTYELLHLPKITAWHRSALVSYNNIYNSVLSRISERQADKWSEYQIPGSLSPSVYSLSFEGFRKTSLKSNFAYTPGSNKNGYILPAAGSLYRWVNTRPVMWTPRHLRGCRRFFCVNNKTRSRSPSDIILCECSQPSEDTEKARV